MVKPLIKNFKNFFGSQLLKLFFGKEGKFSNYFPCPSMKNVTVSSEKNLIDFCDYVLSEALMVSHTAQKSLLTLLQLRV